MIWKFLKIKNIGKFNITSTDDTKSFGKQTIAFGPNKTGKTTITAIFRSLKDKDSNYVTERKSFWMTTGENQECEISNKDGSRNTFDSTWENDNIEIFDNEFIYKNVFIGNKIEQSHKAELHKTLIDEENIRIQKDIEERELEYKILQNNKDSIKLRIGRNYDSFVKINDSDEINNIEIKIKDNLNKQSQFENQSSLNRLKTTTKLSFNFADFEENLKKGIDTTLESKVRDHIDNHWESSGKDDFAFLESGVRKISEDKNLCPFCSQSLKDVNELVDNMRNFFNPIYKEVQASINNAIEDFKLIDIEKEFAQFRSYGFEFKTPVDVDSLRSNYEEILAKAEEKQTDLSKEVDIASLEIYNSFKTDIKALYSEISSLTLESMNIVALKQEEAKLIQNKERFSEDGMKNYNDYLVNEQELKDKKKEIDNLNNALKDSINETFSKYQEEINNVLTDSYANYKLAKLESISNRTLRESHYCDYGFMFDNAFPVDITNEEGKPQFKNTLSDSDKRILAFAFFIARLRKDPSLEDKIVVLDDPFTSLDEDRRDSMINVVLNLQCEQIIILSHNRSFVKRCNSIFSKGLGSEDKDIKTLRLLDRSGKTDIVQLDIGTDNDFLDGIDSYLQPLLRADVSNINSEYDNIRRIIEYVVKAKYGLLLDQGNREVDLPMRYFNNSNCKSPMKGKIQDADYQENHHDADNRPTPEELLQKRDDFIENVLPQI